MGLCLGRQVDRVVAVGDAGLCLGTCRWSHWGRSVSGICGAREEGSPRTPVIPLDGQREKPSGGRHSPFLNAPPTGRGGGRGTRLISCF